MVSFYVYGGPTFLSSLIIYSRLTFRFCGRQDVDFGDSQSYYADYNHGGNSLTILFIRCSHLVPPVSVPPPNALSFQFRFAISLILYTMRCMIWIYLFQMITLTNVPIKPCLLTGS